jgi:Zn-dependent protease
LSPQAEEKLVFFGCLVVAIILHEISHGVVALWFGDDTAKRAHRLTLNPVRHVDPFGTIILPAMLTIAGFGAFGYAKPVPVDPSKLREPRRDMLFVGLAGPFTNFLLMLAAGATVHVLLQRWLHAHPFASVGAWADLPLVIQIAWFFALGNLLLGVFNLLPIPPLDGSSLIERVLPRAWLPGWYRFRPYGFAILLLLLLSTNAFGVIFAPFQRALARAVWP